MTSKDDVRKFMVDGREFQYRITDSGNFESHVDGENYSFPTLDQLKKRLLKIRRQKHVSLPAMIVSRNMTEIESVTIVGVHAGNGNILYEDAAGRTCQSRTHDYQTFIFPLPPGKLDRFYRIQVEIAKLTEENNMMVQHHTMQVDKELASLGVEADAGAE